MEDLKIEIKKLAEEELERANEKFPLFHSDHEGLGVLEEEMFEVDEPAAEEYDETENYGSLTVNGDALEYNETLYTLNLSENGDLTLFIAEIPDDTPPVLTLNAEVNGWTQTGIVVSAEAGSSNGIQKVEYSYDGSKWFIGDKVKIGKNCIIHPNVTIYNHVIIGDNVIIQSGSVIGGDACYFQRRPDGFVKFESCGRVIIEDDVEIGACCCVDIGVTSDTIVGKGTKMDNFVQIGHDAKLGKNCFLGAHASVGGVTIVKDNVSIWAMGSVNKDLVIAEGTVVLAYSGVDKDTLPGKTYFGAMKKWREIATIKALSNK